MSRWALAPAKVNLFLHVGARRPDGFHPIASLMAFADVGDRLSARPGDGLELEVEGPFGGHAPAGEDNLVMRAARALAGPNGRASLRLEKRLPAGAGLGGGSADAAAALRLLGGGQAVERLMRVTAALGADVPACLVSRPLMAEGRGERLTPWGVPPLPAVLVWPAKVLGTAEVYRAFDESSWAGEGGQPRPHVSSPPERARGREWGWRRSRKNADAGCAFGAASTPIPDPSPFQGEGRSERILPDPAALPARETGMQQWVAFFASCRNDLEAPAIRLQPLIGEVLQALRGEPETLLARMSGSGSACFALCNTLDEAQALAGRLAGRYPRWWVRACTLGEPPLWEDET